GAKSIFHQKIGHTLLYKNETIRSVLMSIDFYSAVKKRRSCYTIDQEVPVSDKKILEVVQFAVKHTPSAFNSQSARVVVLLKQHHHQLWDITERTLRKLVPEESFAATQEKMNSFR